MLSRTSYAQTDLNPPYGGVYRKRGWIWGGFKYPAERGILNFWGFGGVWRGGLGVLEGGFGVGGSVFGER